MTVSKPEPLQRPCPAATGQDFNGGCRSRIQRGHARWRSRRLKSWRPRLPSEVTVISQKTSGRFRGRISGNSSALRQSVLAPGTLRMNTLMCSRMTTPTAAQADHF